MRIPFILLQLFFFAPVLFGETTTPKLSIVHVSGDFYVYTTYNTYQENQVPANGMYLVTQQGVVMFDTPWDTTQFQPLLDSIQSRHHAKVILCIATHWHSDKTAGLAYYKHRGIKTYTTALTDSFSNLNNKKRAEFLIHKDTVFHVGQYSFETYFPGEGHTLDNIVIWFEKEKILYGGCLIKGADAKNLGYTDDGNKTAYVTTLKNVQSKFPNPSFIIIAHSDWHNKKSLSRSIKLAKRLRRKNAY